MMKTSQVCEMFVLDFVGCEVALSSVWVARIRKGCLLETAGNLGPRNKSFSPNLGRESAIRMFFQAQLRLVRALVNTRPLKHFRWREGSDLHLRKIISACLLES